MSNKTLNNANDHSSNKIQSVLKCNNCATWWNRDQMASMNTCAVFMHMAVNGNRRPNISSPPSSTVVNTDNALVLTTSVVFYVISSSLQTQARSFENAKYFS
ncbi:MAG: hypothetical protein EXX96DRAFT_543095 [Benjaminiella poitrasii]|nr:MAG: hypothetical protein EXX96DRAFT_543095 [Benjaminiella poitrasii]